MLTRNHYQAACTLGELSPIEFKKGNVIVIDGVQRIVTAKLSADAENPITYSVCNIDMTQPQLGISLSTARLVPTDELSEQIQKRARNFV